MHICCPRCEYDMAGTFHSHPRWDSDCHLVCRHCISYNRLDVERKHWGQQFNSYLQHAPIFGCILLSEGNVLWHYDVLMGTRACYTCYCTIILLYIFYRRIFGRISRPTQPNPWSPEMTQNPLGWAGWAGCVEKSRLWYNMHTNFWIRIYSENWINTVAPPCAGYWYCV